MKKWKAGLKRCYRRVTALMLTLIMIAGMLLPGGVEAKQMTFYHLNGDPYNVEVDDTPYEGYGLVTQFGETLSEEKQILYTRPWGSGEEGRFAYCFNHERAYPKWNYVNDITNVNEYWRATDNSNATFVTVADNEQITEGLKERVLSIVWNGYPYNASGIYDTLKAEFESDSQFASIYPDAQHAFYQVTQNVIWYWTDGWPINEGNPYNNYLKKYAVILNEMAVSNPAPDGFDLDLFLTTDINHVSGHDKFTQNLLTTRYAPRLHLKINLNKNWETPDGRPYNGETPAVTFEVTKDGAPYDTITIPVNGKQTEILLEDDESVYTFIEQTETNTTINVDVPPDISGEGAVITDNASRSFTVDFTKITPSEGSLVSQLDATFTNEATGSLTVEKDVQGGDTDQSFTFDINLKEASGQPLSGSYPYTGSADSGVTPPDNGTLTVTDGKGQITLKHGQAITVTGLPTGSVYTVTEQSVADYTCAPTGDTGVIPLLGTASAAFVNTYTAPETISIPVTKAWEDNNNQDGIRPEKVTIHLVADGKDTGKTIELNRDNEWRGKFDNLPKTADGKDIVYTITEDKVEGYETTIAGDGVTGFTVTNRHATETISIPVTKAWDDADNQDGIRPDKIVVHLFADGKDTGKTIELNRDNEWRGKFDNLPKKADGKDIAYTITEDKVEGYEATLTGDMAAGFTLTNRRLDPKDAEVVLRALKTLDGGKPQGERFEFILKDSQQQIVETRQNNQDGAVAFSPLRFDAEGTYTYTIEEKQGDNPLILYDQSVYTVQIQVVEDVEAGQLEAEAAYFVDAKPVEAIRFDNRQLTRITGQKIWDDRENQDGIRPDKITIRLLANGTFKDQQSVSAQDHWQWSFEGLPLKDINGKEITYTITEDKVAGYEATLTGDMAAGFTVTNRHVTESISIPVTKAWDDADNQDGIRPDKITVKLLADGKDTGKTIELNEDNEWTGKFDNLPKKADGKDIAYTITEDKVAGYEATLTGDMAAGFTLTNSHKPETVSIPVTKMWKDNNNQDNLRPDKVTVHLFANGKDTGLKLELNEKSAWRGLFADLPKYQDGEAIVYTVTEDPIDGYKGTITGNAVSGYVITNYHNVSGPSTGISTQTPAVLILLCTASGALLLIVKRKQHE